MVGHELLFLAGEVLAALEHTSQDYLEQGV